METMEQGKPTLTARHRGSAGMSGLYLNSIGGIRATMQIAAAPLCTVATGAEIVFASSETCRLYGITWH
jgi:hypothetical protein